MSTNIVSEIVHFAGHTAHPPASRRRLDRPGVSIVRACVSCLARSALHLERPVLLPVMCRCSGCAGAHGTPEGHIADTQPRPVSLSTTEKNKKGSKKLPYPLLPISKIPPQKQKDPYKGSAFCAILALQALKGRNLQWLKVK